MTPSTIPEKGQDQCQEQHRADGWEGLVLGKQLTELQRGDCAGAMAPT